jgi:hypothetical protein
MQIWFPTLNAALDSENLTHLWPLGANVNYGETIGLAAAGFPSTATNKADTSAPSTMRP